MSSMSKQEQTWRGEFGDLYTDRNQFGDNHIQDCAQSFATIFSYLPEAKMPHSILEVGCNIGRNLKALSHICKAELFGIEPNQKARQQAQEHKFINPSNIRDAIGSSLPFDDKSIDLVFTSVVLIHIPEDQISATLSEIYRVSKRFILAIEYFNPTTQLIPYRNHDDLLFKRDYGSLYMNQFPDLRLLGYGFFWKRVMPSQDNTTWWLFEKSI